MSAKRSFILRQTCSFQLQVCLSMYHFLVDPMYLRIYSQNSSKQFSYLSLSYSSLPWNIHASEKQLNNRDATKVCNKTRRFLTRNFFYSGQVSQFCISFGVDICNIAVKHAGSFSEQFNTDFLIFSLTLLFAAGIRSCIQKL